MKLYAITDSRLFAGDRQERRQALMQQVLRWVGVGVDFIQIREKHVRGSELETLALELRETVFACAGKQDLAAPRILLNAGSEEHWQVARTARLDGVHLPGDAEPLADRMSGVSEIWAGGGAEEAIPIVSVACHTVDEVVEASAAGASLILFAPVFEKPIAGGALPGVGVSQLRAACAAAGGVPVFALGGITPENAAACVTAGAVGVAGIRLFAGDAWVGLARR